METFTRAIEAAAEKARGTADAKTGGHTRGAEDGAK
jgi:hypothetical protein